MKTHHWLVLALSCDVIAPPASAQVRPAPRVFSSSIDAPPKPGCDANSISSAAACDLSHVALPVTHSITGAATLGRPATGYLYTDNAYPLFGYLYNSSGWNNSPSSNNGRTAAAFSRVHVYQDGQGDAVAYNATAFIASACKPNATSVLACPAASLFNGDMSAARDSVFLNPYETVINDKGHGVAGIGNVNNLIRTSAKRPLGDEWWAGYRAQSKGGVGVDVAFSAAGSFNIGLDLSFAKLPSNGRGEAPFNCVSCAITLAPDQRIYLAAVPVDSSGLWRFPKSSGESWITYQNANSAVQVVTNNSTAALLKETHAFIYGSTQLAAASMNRFEFSGAAAGKAPAIRLVSASEKNVDGQLAALGSGSWSMANEAGAIRFVPGAVNQIATSSGHTVLADKTVTIEKDLVLSALPASATVCTDAAKHLVPCSPLHGRSGPIGGETLAAGRCASANVAVRDASPSMVVVVSPATYPGDGFVWQGYVSAPGAVTVKVCAIASGAPAESSYNVRVLQ
ncbi:MAG TPA: hypothetical protein VMZ74_00490 [Ramlibacter sp.]|nr:hypothetical protein [Ramlibacter sp.]